MSAGCGVGGPETLSTGQPGPGLVQPLTVVVVEVSMAVPFGRSVSSHSSRCRLWNSLCPPETDNYPWLVQQINFFLTRWVIYLFKLVDVFISLIVRSLYRYMVKCFIIITRTITRIAYLYKQFYYQIIHIAKIIADKARYICFLKRIWNIYIYSVCCIAKCWARDRSRFYIC